MFKNLLRTVFRMTKISPESVMDSMPALSSTKRLQPDFVSTEENEPASKKPKKKIPNRKYALFVAYQGKNYFGMQVQSPGSNMPTIESHLLEAFQKCDLISEEQKQKPFTFSFQRAARTDRKVSAVRQCISFMLPLTDDFAANGHNELNAHLPNDIRVLTIRRTIPSFHSQKKCDFRTYSYTIPTFAFAGTDSLTQPTFRMTHERREEVNQVLKCFVGTHNFFNYTSKREHSDMSSNRYIISFECGEPFSYVHDYGYKKIEYEFATIYIQGQSFMLHQIRKMIGMTLTVLRGFQNKSDVTRSFEKLRMDVPRAPGLGLILEQVHYRNYDRNFSHIHQKLDSLGEDIEAQVKKIRDELIISEILSTEVLTNSMMLWLADLPKHDFIVNPESETLEKSALAMARGVAADAVAEAKGEKVVNKAEEDDEDAEIDEVVAEDVDESQKESEELEKKAVAQ
uniref:Pseudouridine synthase I TruA alpha/beta domain-containing protein n=1 Tax=Panagrolaimus sp. ES5 TaxID=591445 RepID=A0AC34F0A0_9BILA